LPSACARNISWLRSRLSVTRNKNRNVDIVC
jgi:hypothetical protein